MKATFNDCYSGEALWSGEIEVAEEWTDGDAEGCQSDWKVLDDYFTPGAHVTWDQLCSALVRFLTFDGKKITPGQLSAILNGEWFSMDAMIAWLAREIARIAVLK